MTPYEKSARRHLLRYKNVQLGVIQVPAWLPTLLDRLPTAVPAQHPFEVLCVTGLMCQQTSYDYHRKVGVRLLLQRGWSVEMSMQMFKNFRWSHPSDVIAPDMLRLLSRKQLTDTYGMTFGTVIADVCMDPDTQPVFAALLSGDLDRLVARPASHAVFQVLVDSDLLPDDNSSLPQNFFQSGELHDAGVPTAAPATIPMAEAARLYKDATGCDPEFVFNINPRELDYDALAHSAETVRTPESTG